MALPGVACYNPSFDVTDHTLISGIVTEQGICRPPYTEPRSTRARAPSGRSSATRRSSFPSSSSTGCPGVKRGSKAVRGVLNAAGGEGIRLFAKIENLEGVEKLAELIPASVMAGR